MMLFVDNENITDPRVNLGIEEHLLRNFDTGEDILLFYINEPSIIIGRNQNTLEEINHLYVFEKGIHVVRRLSGGGAVYHDLGNLNFSFITNSGKENFNNFKKFTAPVIKALNELGVHAELGGRNDILVKGRKISGNAQYITGKRMVSHGTLLFDSDLSQVVEALNVKMGKITSKGIKSVRSRVVNISEFLTEPMDIQSFRSYLLDSIFERAKKINIYTLTQEDWQAVQILMDERYNSWEWNYGRSPDFNIQKTQRFLSGEIDARIDVQKGRIVNIKFYGDFLSQGNVAELEQKLIGTRYDRDSLYDKLKGQDLNFYFGEIDTGDFLEFIY
jgi:lipoate---protein ligase